MNITIHDTAKPKTIKYKLAKISNDKFQLYFSSFADRDFILANVKYLWGAPTKNAIEFSINFMGETWKVKLTNNYGVMKNELKVKDAISFERVEKLYYEDPEEPRLYYMLGILEEVYHIENS